MTTILDRVTDALAALRGETDSARHNLLKLETSEVKAVPFPAGRSNYLSWPGQYAGTRFDYAAEVGELVQSSLVMAVVNFTATTLPEAQFQVLKVSDGKTSPDPQHKLTRLLRRPNTYFSGQTMWAAFSISWWIDGNVYFHAIPDGRGRPAELWYVPHFMLEPRWPGDGRGAAIKEGRRLTPQGWVETDEEVFISCYEYTVNGRKYQIAPEEVIHFRRGINPHNIRKGLGAFDSVLREIYGDNASANFAAALLRNYGVTSVYISPKEGVIEMEDALAMKDAYIRNNTGDNAGRVSVNTIPLDIQKLGFNPEELDLSKLRYVPESRVAAVTGIPAAVLQFMVGLENGTSYASYEQAKLQAYESVIFPIQGVILSEIDAQLLVLFDGPNPETSSAFDTSRVRVLQPDEDKKYARLSMAYRNGWIKRSEAREAAGYPVDETDDVYFVTPQAAKVVETDPLQRGLLTAPSSNGVKV